MLNSTLVPVPEFYTMRKHESAGVEFHEFLISALAGVK
jgi:hypothetical protein